jgi:hypothetical protein
MYCVICGLPIEWLQDSSIPTTDGQRVHIACAEREAHAAYRRRTLWAMTSALFVGALLLLATFLEASPIWLIVLGLLFLVGHVAANCRWWLLTMGVMRRRK